MVGEMVQNSQSLYSFTFSAVIFIHEYIYSHSTTKFIFRKYINSHLKTVFLFTNIFTHIYTGIYRTLGICSTVMCIYPHSVIVWFNVHKLNSYVQKLILCAKWCKIDEKYIYSQITAHRIKHIQREPTFLFDQNGRHVEIRGRIRTIELATLFWSCS